MRQEESKISQVALTPEFWSVSDSFSPLLTENASTVLTVDLCTAVVSRNLIEVDDASYQLYQEFGCILPVTVYIQGLEAVKQFIRNQTPELEILKQLCEQADSIATSRSLRGWYLEESVPKVGQVMSNLVALGLVERWFVGSTEQRAWRASKFALSLREKGIYTDAVHSSIGEIDRLVYFVERISADRPPVVDF